MKFRLLLLPLLLLAPPAAAAPSCLGDQDLGVDANGVVSIGPAAGRFRFAKYDQRATDGSCVRPVGPNDSQQRVQILQSFGDSLSIEGSPSDLETHGLAEFLFALDRLGKGSAPELRDRSWTVSYLSHRTVNGQRSYASTCVGTHLQLVSGCQNGRQLPADRRVGGNRNNTALIAHEWAHCLGWFPLGNSTYYESYFEAVPERCLATHRSEFPNMPSPRNEEFAEVFALYLLDPDVLHKAGCQSALAFFGGLFGEDDTSKMTCSSRRSYFAGS